MDKGDARAEVAALREFANDCEYHARLEDDEAEGTLELTAYGAAVVADALSFKADVLEPSEEMIGRVALVMQRDEGLPNYYGRVCRVLAAMLQKEQD